MVRKRPGGVPRIMDGPDCRAEAAAAVTYRRRPTGGSLSSHFGDFATLSDVASFFLNFSICLIVRCEMCFESMRPTWGGRGGGTSLPLTKALLGIPSVMPDGEHPARKQMITGTQNLGPSDWLRTDGFGIENRPKTREPSFHCLRKSM